MQHRSATKQLLLAVSPVLLADVLWRALRFQGLDVVLYGTPEHHVSAQPHQYALALVSSDLPADVAADVVIRLPEAADLPDILELVESSLAASSGVR